MEITKIINKIDKLIENIDYEKVYLDIQAEDNRYTIEKAKKRWQIGFKTE